jgi:hypothetical protein
LATGIVVMSAVLIISTTASASAETMHVLALAGDVKTVLDNIRNWIMGILAVIATTFLTIGGVRYMAAGGDPGQLERAKAAFRSAGIGYGLAALSPVVVGVLQNIVGG